MKRFLREIIFDAAFIKDHTLQPQWYKVLKIILIAGFLSGFFMLFGGKKLLVFCGVFFGLSLVVHMLYRLMTKKYSQSWLDFKVNEKEDGELEYQQIGIYYYSMVLFNLAVALISSLLLVDLAVEH